MTLATLTAEPEAAQLTAMKHTFATAPLHQHYFTRVVSQPLNLDGLAFRVQEAFGNGELYNNPFTADGNVLVYLPEPSIPSQFVREALQTVALDRVVAEAVRAESFLAAERHLAGDPVCEELRHIPRGCLARDVRGRYLEILRGLLEIPDYRDQVGEALPELF